MNGARQDHPRERSPDRRGDWVVIVPAKPPARGKTRLGLPDEHRHALARAFALDTTTAARLAEEVGVVLAVTDDSGLARELARIGCEVLPDGVGDDLNGTLVQAAAEARRRWPSAWVAVLCADLPALRPADLDSALVAASRVVTADGPAAFVTDHEGTGTTLYAASYDDFAPRFGPGSAAAHADGGGRRLDGAWESLRRDVDTAADITTTATLGLGPHSAAAVVDADPSYMYDGSAPTRR